MSVWRDRGAILPALPAVLAGGPWGSGTWFPWFEIFEGGESFEAAVATEEVCHGLSMTMFPQDLSGTSYVSYVPPVTRQPTSQQEFSRRCALQVPHGHGSHGYLDAIKHPKLDNFEPNTQVGIIWHNMNALFMGLPVLGLW